MNAQTRQILDELNADEQKRKETDRNTPSTQFPGLSVAEGNFMRHMSMWGWPGHPVRKMGRKWFWVEAFAVTGTPSPFKTKKAAHEQIDRYLSLLNERMIAARNAETN